MRNSPALLSFVVAATFLFSASAQRARAEPVQGGVGTVAGKVIGKDGKAVGGATVKLFARAEGAGKKAAKGAAAGGAAKAKREKRTPIAEGTTDGEGKFSLANVPSGNYTVSASMKGVGVGRSRLIVHAGQTADVTLTLAPKQPKGTGGGKKNADREARKLQKLERRAKAK